MYNFLSETPALDQQCSFTDALEQEAMLQSCEYCIGKEINNFGRLVCILQDKPVRACIVCHLYHHLFFVKPLVAADIKKKLSSYGYDVLVASDAEEILQCLLFRMN